jgi:hypothetical protein
MHICVIIHIGREGLRKHPLMFKLNTGSAVVVVIHLCSIRNTGGNLDHESNIYYLHAQTPESFSISSSEKYRRSPITRIVGFWW